MFTSNVNDLLYSPPIFLSCVFLFFFFSCGPEFGVLVNVTYSYVNTDFLYCGSIPHRTNHFFCLCFSCAIFYCVFVLFVCVWLKCFDCIVKVHIFSCVFVLFDVDVLVFFRVFHIYFLLRYTKV